ACVAGGICTERRDVAGIRLKLQTTQRMRRCTQSRYRLRGDVVDGDCRADADLALRHILPANGGSVGIKLAVGIAGSADDQGATGRDRHTVWNAYRDTGALNIDGDCRRDGNTALACFSGATFLVILLRGRSGLLFFAANPGLFLPIGSSRSLRGHLLVNVGAFSIAAFRAAVL